MVHWFFFWKGLWVQLWMMKVVWVRERERERVGPTSLKIIHVHCLFRWHSFISLTTQISSIPLIEYPNLQFFFYISSVHVLFFLNNSMPVVSICPRHLPFSFSSPKLCQFFNRFAHVPFLSSQLNRRCHLKIDPIFY